MQYFWCKPVFSFLFIFLPFDSLFLYSLCTCEGCNNNAVTLYVCTEENMIYSSCFCTTQAAAVLHDSLLPHPSPPLSALPLSDSGSEPQPLVSAWQQDAGGNISLSQRMMNKCVHPKTAGAICIHVFILRTTPGHPEWIIAQEYKRGRGHFQLMERACF